MYFSVNLYQSKVCVKQLTPGTSRVESHSNKLLSLTTFGRFTSITQ